MTNTSSRPLQSDPVELNMFNGRRNLFSIAWNSIKLDHDCFHILFGSILSTLGFRSFIVSHILWELFCKLRIQFLYYYCRLLFIPAMLFPMTTYKYRQKINCLVEITNLSLSNVHVYFYLPWNLLRSSVVEETSWQ